MKNIEWTEKTWNPITGCNGPGGKRCLFCYAQRFAYRFKGIHGYPEEDPFKPAFHEERLEQVYKRKKPTVYFFGSMCDHLDEGVEIEWRRKSYQAMADNPQHLLISMNKRYENLWKVEYDSPNQRIPDNLIVGISVNKRNQVWGMDELRKVKSKCRMVSFEPLLEDLANIVEPKGMQWFIIGAQTRQSGVGDLESVQEFQPPSPWIEKLVKKAKANGIPVFVKPNAKKYYPGPTVYDIEREFPFRLNASESGFVYNSISRYAMERE